ncbi:NADPH-dependent F420 reductase [Streptomyces sp. NPDC059816]|uniref:NADPH-dependent F420 reductase n=1 Tax=Streptomyces sp. NPDC059816 TaxID=3346960 RepID=UPI0036586CB8
MQIGIIGAGQIGGNLARRLAAVGHSVTIVNSRGPHTLGELVAETGVTAGASAADVVRGARVVVVTVPLKAVPDLPSDLFDGADDDLVVIETHNYYPRERDGLIAEIEDGLPESRWVERHLGRPVVKVFNGTYAEDITAGARPAGAPDRIAVPVAGDDEAAKRVVRDLVDEIGFDTVDAGGLDDSWRQQPDTPVYGLRGGVDAVVKALAEADRERPAAFRAHPAG